MQPATSYKDYLTQMQKYLQGMPEDQKLILNVNNPDTDVTNQLMDALSTLQQLHNLLEGELTLFSKVDKAANFDRNKLSSTNGTAPKQTGYEKLMDGISDIIQNPNADFNLNEESNKIKSELVYKFAQKMKMALTPPKPSGLGVKPEEKPQYRAMPTPFGMKP